MSNIKDTIKSKTFWGGFLSALGALVAGSATFPEFLTSLIQLIGG